MAFSGYFIKGKKTGYTSFPHKYIADSGYTTTPNVREEIKAYRDDNTRNLHRVTASGMKTSIQIKLLSGLNVAELKEVLTFFNKNYNNAKQRRLTLEYWNMEDLEYKNSDFYVSDIEYSVEEITKTDMRFSEVTISLVEY